MKNFYEFSEQVRQPEEKLDEFWGPFSKNSAAQDKFNNPAAASAAHRGLDHLQRNLVGRQATPAQAMRYLDKHSLGPDIRPGMFQSSLKAVLGGLEQFRQGLRSLYGELHQAEYSNDARRPNMKSQFEKLGGYSNTMSRYFEQLKSELEAFTFGMDQSRPPRPDRDPDPQTPPPIAGSVAPPAPPMPAYRQAA